MISKYLIVIIRLKDIHNCEHKKIEGITKEWLD